MKDFWNSEKIIGIVAFVISIGTLFTFIYQTNIMREHQKASVLPYLEIWNTNINNDLYELNLYNNGIGPAFIENVKVYHNDTVFNRDPDYLVKYLVATNDTIDKFYYMCSNVGKGRLIRPGEKVTMVSANANEKDVITLRNMFRSKHTRVEITFSSVYGDKWVTKGVGVPPKKLD